MKIQTKLIVITIILLLVLGFFAYKNVKTTGSVILINNYDKGFDYNDYCEYNSETDTCLPADKCEFQTDNDGTKICLGKY